MQSDHNTIKQLALKAGIKQTPGVDDCYILSLDQIESLVSNAMESAALVAERQASRWDGMRDGYIARECAAAIRGSTISVQFAQAAQEGK